MKELKRLLTVIIRLIFIITMTLNFSVKAVSNITEIESKRPVEVGVLVYSDNVFGFLVAENLKDIVNEKGDKVKFTVFNGEENPARESELLNKMLNDNYDLLLVDIAGQTVPDLIDSTIKKAKGIPIIFFDVTPVKLDVIRSYPKALIINNDSKQAGTLQGKMIADEWNANKAIMDKNKDDILQYVMIKGNEESFATKERTMYVLKAIKEAGIKTQELASVNANWNQDLSEEIIASLFIKYDGKIEAIIVNNHSMAVGAVKALQKYGYNMGDKKKTIPVFAINISPEIEEMIKKGSIAGTVPRNPRTYAEVIYAIGMNLINSKNPLEGTNYKFDETGVVIKLPFEEYKTQTTQDK